MVSGSATSIPLFGWWSIVAAALVVLIALFILLQPRIYDFQVAAGKNIIELGDTTNLDWSVSPFATRLNISGQDKVIDASMTHLTVNPAQSTIYELVAGNWLSGLAGLDQKWLQTVLVIPPSPSIAAFDVDHTAVNKGLPVVIRWSVTKADKVLLTIGEVVAELPKEQFSGEKSIILDQDTVVTLEAQSGSGSELRSAFVKIVPPHITVNKFTVWVRPPSTAIPGTATSALDLMPHLASLLPLVTSTAVPTPVITPTAVPTSTAAAADTASVDFPQKFVELIPDKTAENGYRVQFDQPKRQLSKGEQVMVEWDVDGTDTVAITPFTDVLPAKGKQPFFPQQSLNFVMSAKSGELAKLFMLPVTVFDGTPPVAPTIQFFKGAPTASVGAASVQFSWSVSGAWTHIKLTTGDTVVADWVNAQGFITTTVSTSATYVLTAWNGQLSTATPLDITINPTLKASTLTITDVYPHAGYFKVNDSVNVYISITNLPAGIAAPTGTVTVTDDYATCQISLPVKFCTLKFNTPGTKQIKATYSGDAVYLPEDSAVYTKESIVVVANQVNLSPTFFYRYNSTTGPLINDLGTAKILVGQGLKIIVAVTPVNSTMADDDKNGSVTVRQCPINAATNLPDTSNCLSYGPVTVTVTKDATGTNTGSADVILPYTQRKGNFGLLISYAHSTGAFDPKLVGSTADDKIPFTVDYGDLLLIPQGITADSCTYKGGTGCIVHQGNPVDMAFTTKLMLKEVGIPNDIMLDLFSTFPLPSKLVVTATQSVPTTTPPTTAKVMDWSNKCAWQVISAKRQLLCSGVDMTYPVTIAYSFLGGSDANYVIKNRSLPVSVMVKKATSINYVKTAIDQKYVGQKIQLQESLIGLTSTTGGANIYTYLTNEPTTAIPNAVTYFRLTDTTLKMSDILTVMTSTGCAFISDAKGIALTQTGAHTADSCIIYFKKAGTYSLTLLYAPDAPTENDTSQEVISVTILKQNGLTLSWSPTLGSSYPVYTNIPIVTGDTGTDLTFNCPTGATESGCTDFVSGVLDLATVAFNTSSALNCSTYQDTAVLQGGAATLSNNQLLKIKFRCATLGDKTIAVGFTGDSLSSLDFATGPTVSFKITSLLRDISPQIFKFDDSSLTTSTLAGSTTKQFKPILVGETYHMDVQMDQMPIDMAPDHTIDRVSMVWPLEMANLMDTTKSTCNNYFYSSDPTTATYKIPFDVVTGTSSWKATCKFVFSGTAGTLSTSSIIYTLDDSRVSPKTTPTETISLDTSISKDSKIIIPDLRIDDGTPSYKEIMTGAGTPYGMSEPFYVGEDYYVYAQVGNIPSDVSADSSYFLMTWPSDFDSLLSSTTCALQNSTVPGVYKLSLSKITGNGPATWQASCMFRFAKMAPLNYPFSGKQIDLSFSSPRYSATPVDINIYHITDGIQQRKPNIDVSVTVPTGNSIPGTAELYYARTSPSIEAVIKDNHYKQNVTTNLSLANFQVSLSGGNAADRTYAPGTDCTLTTSSDGATATLKCPITATTYYSTGGTVKELITVAYTPGTNTIFAPTDNHTVHEGIIPIPVTFDLANLKSYATLADQGNHSNPLAFPEHMACQGCASSSAMSQSFIKRLANNTNPYKYYLSVPVTVASGFTINGSAPVVGDTTTSTPAVPGGTLTFKLMNNTDPNKSHLSSASGVVQDGYFDATFSVANTPAGFPNNSAIQVSDLYCALDLYYHWKQTTCATAMSLTYNDDNNKVAAGNPSVLPKTGDPDLQIYIKDEVTFSISYGDKSVTVTSNYKNQNICFDVFFEDVTTNVICEPSTHGDKGESCWHEDDGTATGTSTDSTYNKAAGEYMAIQCDDKTFGYSNPKGCSLTSGTPNQCFTYVGSGGSGDNNFNTNNTVATGDALQYWLNSWYMIGYFYSSSFNP